MRSTALYNFKTPLPRRLWLLPVLATLGPGFQAIAAEDLVGQWYLQPSLHIQSENDPYRIINHKTLNIGKALNKRINLEISLLSDQQDIRNDNRNLLIDGRYYLKTNGGFTPYIAGGISGFNTDLPINTDQTTMTNIGLGFEHTYKHNGTRIQADIRYFMDDNNARTLATDRIPDWTMSIGISIPLSTDLIK